MTKNLCNNLTIKLCHSELFGYAQDKLCEESLVIPPSPSPREGILTTNIHSLCSSPLGRIGGDLDCFISFAMTTPNFLTHIQHQKHNSDYPNKKAHSITAKHYFKGFFHLYRQCLAQQIRQHYPIRQFKEIQCL